MADILQQVPQEMKDTNMKTVIVVMFLKAIMNIGIRTMTCIMKQRSTMMQNYEQIYS